MLESSLNVFEAVRVNSYDDRSNPDVVLVVDDFVV